MRDVIDVHSQFRLGQAIECGKRKTGGAVNEEMVFQRRSPSEIGTGTRGIRTTAVAPGCKSCACACVTVGITCSLITIVPNTSVTSTSARSGRSVLICRSVECLAISLIRSLRPFAATTLPCLGGNPGKPLHSSPPISPRRVRPSSREGRNQSRYPGPTAPARHAESPRHTRCFAAHHSSSRSAKEAPRSFLSATSRFTREFR